MFFGVKHRVLGVCGFGIDRHRWIHRDHCAGRPINRNAGQCQQHWKRLFLFFKNVILCKTTYIFEVMRLHSQNQIVANWGNLQHSLSCSIVPSKCMYKDQ